jgi:hypothetical protein
VSFYTDTGGGFNSIAASVAERYSLAKAGVVAGDAGEEYELVEFPGFAEQSGVPRPAQEPWLRGNLVLVQDGSLEADGMLGNR